MRCMTDQPVKKRLAETGLGTVLGWILALGWMVVMACTDINAYTALPLCVVGGVAVLLFAVGVLRGDKMVRLTPTAWLGLAVGLYFLLRCVAAPSLVESWGHAALLLGCVVYYVAGIQAAQGSGRAVVGTLVVAVLVNAVYFGLMRLPEASVAWSGRPELGLTGPNSQPTGLFFYENFAGYFFMACGFVLLYLSLTSRASRGRRLILLIPALLSMGLAGCCNTLSPLIASLILLPFGWVLFCLHRVASGRSLGFASFLVSAFLLVAISVAVYGLVWGHFFDWLANDVDTHLRYQIWGDLVQQLGASGLWGQGAGASQWSIATIFNEWCRPNFAHNEYLQAWVDFGGVGLALMLLFLVLHLSAGLMTLSSDAITPERRQLVSVALLLMASMSVCAFSDYYWHDAAMALMMAFTCGLLASPHDRRGERLIRRVGSHDLSAEPVLRRVRAAGLLDFVCAELAGTDSAFLAAAPGAAQAEPVDGLLVVVLVESPVMGKVVAEAVGHHAECRPCGGVGRCVRDAVEGVAERGVTAHDEQGAVTVLGHHARQSFHRAGPFALYEVEANTLIVHVAADFVPALVRFSGAFLGAVDDAPCVVCRHSACVVSLYIICVWPALRSAIRRWLSVFRRAAGWRRASVWGSPCVPCRETKSSGVWQTGGWLFRVG